ncbi:MAG: chemotaxis protein CheB [Polyangiaceae bacterium]
MLNPQALPTKTRAVVIGVSAGAIGALSALLPAISPPCAIPVIVVVHVPAGKPSLLVELFASRCLVPVREPLDKQAIEPAIWFAPPDYHLLIDADGTFSLTVDEPVNFSRPAIDVLFETAAEAYGKDLVGIVLTGASEDGARGARAIREAGGFVMVQDPSTAEMATMPQAAITFAKPQLIGSLNDLAGALAVLTSKGSS